MLTNKAFLLLIILTAAAEGFLFKRKPSRVCHGKYGCFNKHPGVRWGFLSISAKLPQSPSDVGTKFTMFTRNGSGEVDDVGVSRLRAAKFNITRRTILVIHGWRDNTKGWATRMKNALKNRVDCNVILVDWSKGANRDYFQSAGNTQLVGAQVGELIRFLISSAPGSPNSVDKFYVIGFSLGAQAAGYAGTYLKDEASMTLGRITGLDPAGPLFTDVGDARFRLDPSDAKYVDVILTDMPQKGGLVGFGMRKEAGHANFFPNGGVRQPGCKQNLAKLAIFQTVICDHMRAPEYYIASVQNNCSWKALPCHSLSDCEAGKNTTCDGKCPSMGYDADKTDLTGNYYLKTNSNPPFCGLS
nr:pancreatic triacylglycerol lipase-like [Pocillopora verrucosa]